MKCRNYRSTFGTTDEFGIVFEDESLAVQASKEECDINTIVKRYLRTGELPQVRQGAFADISGMVGLADSLNMVIEAERSFMALPAEIRREFDNDPVKLVHFANSTRPEDRERAVRLGLLAPLAAPSGVSTPAPAGTAPTALGAAPPVST